MLNLSCCRRDVSLVSVRLLLWCGPSVDSAIAAVVTNPVRSVAGINDSCVVDVMDLGHVDIRHRSVVEEVSAIPASADEPVPKITEPVVNASVEPNLRPPISVVKNERSVGPCPIRWSP